MLQITIDMVPFGITEDTKTIYVGEIINDGSGTVSSGNYTASFTDAETGAEIGRVEIKGFDRRHRSALELISECLQALFNAGGVK